MAVGSLWGSEGPDRAWVGVGERQPRGPGEEEGGREGGENAGGGGEEEEDKGEDEEEGEGRAPAGAGGWGRGQAARRPAPRLIAPPPRTRLHFWDGRGTLLSSRDCEPKLIMSDPTFYRE